MKTFLSSNIQLIILAGFLLPAGWAQAGITTLVSVDSANRQANGGSYGTSISADGRFVSFNSNADNLVAGDTNNTSDIFVRDRRTGTTTRVSTDSAGGQANNSSFYPSISANGRFVAFLSPATNLVAGDDTNRKADIFVHDRHTGTTTRVTMDNSIGWDKRIEDVSISANGRFVVFSSHTTNLVAGDTNDRPDIFVHDHQTGAVTRVNMGSAGDQANGDSRRPSISAGGRFVAFASDANNLVAGDTNGSSDVFIYDRRTGTTTRVSMDNAGGQGNGDSRFPSISPDGRFVAFESRANNLVMGDTNGSSDVFIYDRRTGTTTRASVDSAGNQVNSISFEPSISANGRFVAFESIVNTPPNQREDYPDIFVYDRKSGTTTQVSVDSAGMRGDDLSAYASLSADGRFVAFASIATNLVVGDTNNKTDIFVHQLFCGRDANCGLHPPYSR